MIQAFNFHCQGESHKKNDNKPCQDYSISSAAEDIAIAIVSDGHGGDRYFRSHFGSEFLSKITKDSIIETFLLHGKNLFEGKHFTQVGISKERKDKNIDESIEKFMQKFFAHIITQWYNKIQEHAKNSPLDEWEEKHVPDSYKQEFNEQKRLEKNYGCTLMAYVQTSTYWFAFQIGDGKCLSFHMQDETLTWQEPILWDEACFLNTTTSICDSNAIEEFRYSYCGDGTFPFAVFLGSDGVDDSYGTSENLATFYQQLLQEMANKTQQEMISVLEESLPTISRIGSQDDMSVACVYNNIQVKEAQNAILSFQKGLKVRQLDELKDRKKHILDKIKNIASRANDRAKEVELKYANNDLAKVEKDIQNIHAFLEKVDAKIIISEQKKEIIVCQKRNDELSSQIEEAKKHREKLLEELELERLQHKNTKTRLQQNDNQILLMQGQINQYEDDKKKCHILIEKLKNENKQLVRNKYIFMLMISVALVLLLFMSVISIFLT